MGLKGFSTKQREYLSDIISGFTDELLKSICANYLEECFQGELLDNMNTDDATGYYRNFYALRYILSLFKFTLFNQLSWTHYCLIMNELNKINLELTVSKRRSVIINKEISLNISCLKRSRIILRSLYVYILDNCPRLHNDLINLNQNKHFLIAYERPIYSNPLPPLFIRENVYTNFPLNSEVDKLYLFQPISEDKDIHSVIINFNTNNPFIHQVLKGFIETSCSKKFLNKNWRLFFYYFRSSLSFLSDDELPKKVEDFNYTIFSKQYRFYKRINYLNTYKGETFRFVLLLVQFYVYLLTYIEERNIDFNIFKGTSIDKYYLSSSNFGKFYENGFKYLIHRRAEVAPTANRWALETQDSKTRMGSPELLIFDFTGFKDKSLISDCKEYMWYQKNNLFAARLALPTIKEFLNYKYDFDYKRKDVVNISRNNEKMFPLEMVMTYIFYIFEKYENQATRRLKLKHIKAYLRYFKKRYNVNEIILKRLTIPDKDYEGGNPITRKDLHMIAEEFRKQSELSVKDELFFIIFSLALRTKMRLGEIINLRRNCIIDRDYGNIKYYTKTSGGNLVDSFLTGEMIALIERAIDITDQYANLANKKIKHYIFLIQDNRKQNRVSRVTKQFSSRFREIVKKLEGSLSNGMYSAYCLRDTFINSIYEEGIKVDLSIIQISSMTGNSYRTAIKSYRDKADLVQYAEAFSGVTITDVDIRGNIIEREEELEEFDIVLEGAGGCLEKEECSCVILEGIEDKYVCLKCKSFITCVSRIPVFKAKIVDLQIKLEDATSDEEIEFIKIQLKLFGAYYAALLDKKGKK